MISKCLQFHTISNNFIYSSQLRDLKLKSTTDTGVALTHIICSGWAKNLTTNTLAFNIAQFFPSLNHQLLPLILDKAGLDQKISTFFKNYLVGRKTKYLWNNLISLFFNVNIGVGQGLALSPILSVSRLKIVDLVFPYFCFSFYFPFWFIFHFSIFRTWGLGLEVISHTVTSVTSDGVVTISIMGLKRRK